MVATTALLSLVAGFHAGPTTRAGIHRSRTSCVQLGVKGYFAADDVLLVQRSEEDVAAFHQKERNRWDEVYEEDYKGASTYAWDVATQGVFYPGDRVEVVGDVKVKDIENAKGMCGVVTHFEFDDGYEACQTCSTTFPVTVLLD